MQLPLLHNRNIKVRICILSAALFCTLNNVLFAQTNPNRKDVAFVHAALKTHDELVRSDIAKLQLLVQVLDHMNFEDEPYARAAQHRIYGTYLMKAENPETAIQHYKEALRFFLHKEDLGLSSQIACDAGNACQLTGAFESARSYYLLSLDLGKYSTDVSDAYNANYGLARLGLLEGDTAYAEVLLRDYIKKARSDRKYEAVADGYSTLSMISAAKGRSDQAGTLLDQASHYARKSGSKLHESNYFINRGISQFQSGNIDQAMLLFHQALMLRKELKNNRMICDAFYNLGAGHLMQKNIDSASYYFNESRALALAYDLFPDARDAFQALLESTDDPKEQKMLTAELTEVELLMRNKKKMDYFDDLNLNYDSKNVKRGDSIGFPLVTLLILVAVSLIATIIRREFRGY